MTEDGLAYAWGMGSNLQLGSGSEDNQWVPNKVTGKQLDQWVPNKLKSDRKTDVLPPDRCLCQGATQRSSCYIRSN